MKRAEIDRKSTFYGELIKRLEENKILYKEASVFTVFNSPFARFAAGYLGVNPWKVIIPISLLITMVLRMVLGLAYSEFILRVMGGR